MRSILPNPVYLISNQWFGGLTWAAFSHFFVKIKICSSMTIYIRAKEMKNSTFEWTNKQTFEIFHMFVNSSAAIHIFFQFVAFLRFLRKISFHAFQVNLFRGIYQTKKAALSCLMCITLSCRSATEQNTFWCGIISNFSLNFIAIYFLLLNDAGKINKTCLFIGIESCRIKIWFSRIKITQCKTNIFHESHIIKCMVSLKLSTEWWHV